MKALVIGGSSGLGYECAARLAEAHEVMVGSRRGTAPDGCQRCIFDLADFDHTGHPNLGSYDYLLIAGGMGAFYRPDQINRETCNNMFATNTIGPILLMTAYLIQRRHSHKPGRVVAVTSTAAAQAAHGLGIYAATKAAVESWVRAEGRHHRKHGVDLMAASLGWFSSPMVDELKPDVRARAEARCPGGRFARLEEAVMFTLSVLLDREHYIGGGVYPFWEPQGEIHDKN